ncbi:MAG: hypothetical protein WBK67_01970 [Minisyncoccales bacterium]
MPKYTLTFICGHEGTINLTGPRRTREWTVKNREARVCPDCYRKQIEEGREAARAAALAEAEEQELPTLVGTEKQVAWAITIRQQYLEVLAEGLQQNPVRQEIDPALVQAAIESIQQETSAAWWIENGQNASPWDTLNRVAEKYQDLLNLRETTRTATADEAIAEATVRPEKPVSEIPVQIRIRETTVEVLYPERNDTLREIVKQRGFRWSGDCWARTVGQFAGTPVDRAAEIGNLLLRAGFAVRMFDEAAREKAIAGTYEPEYVRWVKRLTGGNFDGWFGFTWEQRNDVIYSAARKIAGSRWARPIVVVPAAQFEAVLDLADEFGFQISPGARDLVEEARAAKEAALIVKPTEGPAPIKGEPKEQTAPGEIDADLRDDD